MFTASSYVLLVYTTLGPKNALKLKRQNTYVASWNKDEEVYEII